MPSPDNETSLTKYFPSDALDSYQALKFSDSKKSSASAINPAASLRHVGAFDIDLEQPCPFKMYMFSHVGNGHVAEVRGDATNIWKALQIE